MRGQFAPWLPPTFSWVQRAVARAPHAAHCVIRASGGAIFVFSLRDGDASQLLRPSLLCALLAAHSLAFADPNFSWGAAIERTGLEIHWTF
ncbi:MAG: hypothetical protein JNK05_37970 [Myxococcales bacterium]|nr:hypothetical protein [Myxococcales bacterium]